MRRMNIWEERGSGIDKVIFEIELYQLPPPDFQVTMQHTKAILFAPMPFAKMSKGERVRATYQHACLKYVSGETMTNSSLRSRFNISKGNAAQASRIIGHALEGGVIRLTDPKVAPKDKSYLPFWA